MFTHFDSNNVFIFFMFAVFKKNNNVISIEQKNKLDFHDFKEVWNKLIKQVLFPHSALLIVDVQNDFISGSLALKNCPAKQDGAEVVPVINNLINTVPFSTIAYTYDWHPEDHCSFFANYTKKKLHKYSPVS